MRIYVLLSAVCLQIGWSYGEPSGVGVYAYQDSAGHRYGGAYELDDAQFYGKGKNGHGGLNPRPPVSGAHSGPGDWANFIPPFMPNFQQNFQFDDFFPEYFNNLENLLRDATGRRVFNSNEPFEPLPPLKPLPSLFPLRPFPSLPPLRRMRPFRFWPPLPMPGFKGPRQSRRAFNKNLENQKLAFNAARKAYDLTSNQAGYIPHSPGRFDNFGGFGDFGYMPLPGPNSAFAGGAVGPGFTHQVAAINPENPAMQNVNVMNRFADTGSASPGNGFYSVSSSSYSSSSNVNGKEQNSRGAETVVNNNGQVTRYKVQN